MKNKILIVVGDPNSINSEIVFKSWKKLNKSIRKRVYLISNYSLLKKQFGMLNYNIGLEKVDNFFGKENENKLKIFDISLKFKNPFKVPLKDTSKFIKESLNFAHNLAIKYQNVGIINCPISKKNLKKNQSGVTEYLASKCLIKNNSEVMLIYNKKLSVSPITTHADIKEISKKITKKLIIKKVLTINSWYKKFLKKKPKIGILGLNPHNAELREKSEEKKIIIPAIKSLNNLNIKAIGPLVADTLFISEYKKFDVIVGMFHDQVLAPFKALHKFNDANITLGLKYFRTSPYHWVAQNLIKKNKAIDKSLLECLKLTYKFLNEIS